jgi:AhpD family alkylhydroperoxidase
MKARIDYTNVPEALRGMYQLEHYIHNSDLEESLVHLVKMRASQINGCAYCLDVHSKDARALGETEQRLYVLDAVFACTSALQRTGADCAGVYPDHHQRLEPPCYHDAY